MNGEERIQLRARAKNLNQAALLLENALEWAGGALAESQRLAIRRAASDLRQLRDLAEEELNADQS